MAAIVIASVVRIRFVADDFGWAVTVKVLGPFVFGEGTLDNLGLQIVHDPDVEIVEFLEGTDGEIDVR